MSSSAHAASASSNGAPAIVWHPHQALVKVLCGNLMPLPALDGLKGAADQWRRISQGVTITTHEGQQKPIMDGDKILHPAYEEASGTGEAFSWYAVVTGDHRQKRRRGPERDGPDNDPQGRGLSWITFTSYSGMACFMLLGWVEETKRHTLVKEWATGVLEDDENPLYKRVKELTDAKAEETEGAVYDREDLATECYLDCCHRLIVLTSKHLDWADEGDFVAILLGCEKGEFHRATVKVFTSEARRPWAKTAVAVKRVLGEELGTQVWGSGGGRRAGQRSGSAAGGAAGGDRSGGKRKAPDGSFEQPSKCVCSKCLAAEHGASPPPGGDQE
ncbi:unnamed protein product [Vitrella brassicaformis CCMP3155]|uniref:Uncharacterized protein n=1 Tax=Vitrella brassicaformis (strain CCMP3155) TaxID=1169540 RepID=A0A0G4GJE9_VITBC|nr:unnamed protein product [Vitrella brassicaformis CCMP3155]|eukprot:CEM29898.1 unnamed protein product [Vitrella brassicaformis CCMP3155]